MRRGTSASSRLPAVQLDAVADEKGSDMDEGSDDRQGMDIEDAAVIVQQARGHAQRELRISQPPILTAWGVIYLLAYGTLWLSVRNQRPYLAPAPWAVAIVVIVVAVSVVVTIAFMARTATGVGGMSAARRRFLVLAFPIGYAGVYLLEAALGHAGAGHSVIAVMGASGPVLVTGLIYMATAAAWLDWPVFGLGAWLVVVAAASGFAGPVGVWAVDGLAGGLGFLAMAVLTGGQRRS